MTSKQIFLRVLFHQPRLPVEGQPPLPSASYGSPPPVDQVPKNSTVSDSTSFDYCPYMDLLRVGSYKRQFHSVKPKTSGYMLYASTMQTTIEQESQSIIDHAHDPRRHQKVMSFLCQN